MHLQNISKKGLSLKKSTDYLAYEDGTGFNLAFHPYKELQDCKFTFE